MDVWVYWILLAVIFAVGEIVSMGFFLAPFAVGALLAAIAAVLGAGDAVSVVVFLVGSTLLFGLVRPVARRHLRTPAQLRTGTAALVGKTAIVGQRVDNDADTGTVKLEGEIWTARSMDDTEVFEVGSRVHVVEIRGATAVITEAM